MHACRLGFPTVQPRRLRQNDAPRIVQDIDEAIPVPCLSSFVIVMVVIVMGHATVVCNVKQQELDWQERKTADIRTKSGEKNAHRLRFTGWEMQLFS
jgi:hypothetical protein